MRLKIDLVFGLILVASKRPISIISRKLQNKHRETCIGVAESLFFYKFMEVSKKANMDYRQDVMRNIEAI